MMDAWISVKNSEDIDDLLGRYYGFHDSCLVGLEYKTGALVDGRCMYFGVPEQRELHMVFHSQWEGQPLELCFSGVRSYFIAGYQDRYSCEILDCYLKIHTDLIPGRDEPIFVWADNDCFSPKDTRERHILHEPMTTYVIASQLKWRFLEKPELQQPSGNYQKIVMLGTAEGGIE